MHIVTEKAKHFCGDPELLAHRMTCRGVPGCSVALLQRGQVTHSAVSGAAGAAPVTEGTLFECASLTKPLFAVLALQLADERLLALDESVPARLGGEPWSQDPDFAKITPRHILSHSSGLPDWHSRPMPMLFAPGTAYSYSGQGYYLLQHLAEKRTGKTLPELFEEHIFVPFRMSRSAVLWTPSVGSAISVGFDAAGKPCRVRSGVDLTGNAPEPNAAWSLYSNAEDYARFICGLLRHRGGLSEDTYLQMSAPQNIANDTIAWGLGVGLVRKHPDLQWHWGDNDGFKSLALWDKRTGDGLVVLTNSDNGLALCYDLAEELTDLDCVPAIAAFIETAE